MGHDEFNGRNAIHHRHFKIHGDDVRQQLGGFVYRFAPIAGDTHHLKLGMLIDNFFQPYLKKTRIIYHQHLQWHVAAPAFKKLPLKIAYHLIKNERYHRQQAFTFRHFCFALTLNLNSAPRKLPRGHNAAISWGHQESARWYRHP